MADRSWSLHAAVDAIAMWTEDLRSQPAVPFVAPPPGPLDCFGSLPRLPSPPSTAGRWEAPSPRRIAGDGRMLVEVTPAQDRGRGIAVLVPPWKLPRLSLLARWTAEVARTGHEVWTLVPPLHLDRTPAGARNGETFLTADGPALRAAFEQLVLEVRVLLALARTRGGATALVGLSLGALGAALAATAPEAPDRVVLLAPPADLHAVVVSTRIGRRLLPALRRGGGVPGAAALPGMLEAFRPDRRAPRAGRVLVAVGGADRIALTGGATALARAWNAELRVYPRGHLTLLFLCRAVRRDVREFLSSCASP